jgi:hypothetical protein
MFNAYVNLFIRYLVFGAPVKASVLYDFDTDGPIILQVYGPRLSHCTGPECKARIFITKYNIIIKGNKNRHCYFPPLLFIFCKRLYFFLLFFFLSKKDYVLSIFFFYSFLFFINN